MSSWSFLRFSRSKQVTHRMLNRNVKTQSIDSRLDQFPFDIIVSQFTTDPVSGITCFNISQGWISQCVQLTPVLKKMGFSFKEISFKQLEMDRNPADETPPASSSTASADRRPSDPWDLRRSAARRSPAGESPKTRTRAAVCLLGTDLPICPFWIQKKLLS